ncbi:hypothetical protein PoB_002717700 [Plakobranchus ocellatus]|uniref:Uncharacterized protein n=1 Tax=Plakobranchus ocellatus TaxID=259542 RepID=A0AAV4A1C1_9GAST|nr:hypothetical protein PoB_002717700 [Plakobranchus ocellatus]
MWKRFVHVFPALDCHPGRTIAPQLHTFSLYTLISKQDLMITELNLVSYGRDSYNVFPALDCHQGRTIAPQLHTFSLYTLISNLDLMTAELNIVTYGKDSTRHPGSTTKV